MKDEYVIPFLWLHGEDEKRIRNMVRVINEGGMNALCVESRPHPDFLGDKWWQDMDTVLSECKKRDMGVWILDDEHFPTGYAAGKAADTERAVRYITEFHLDIPGPEKGAGILLKLPEPYQNHEKPNKVLAVAAARRIKGADMNHATYINLKSDPVEGLIDISAGVCGDVLFWDVPPGIWRVFIISERFGAGSREHDRYLNPLESEGTRILLDNVYEAHYKRYKAEFGKTIRGFFSDEPQFGGGYGYHASLGSFRLMLPWSSEVLSLMEKRLGNDTAYLLSALWTDVGDITASVRFAYMDAVTRLYGENFCGQIGAWCRQRGIEYMGHVVEENNAHARLGIGTGHYFRTLWGQDFAGIDIVLSGLIPGLKGASHAQWSEVFEADDDFYYYCLAQLAVSLSHIDSKKRGRAMCEIFGAYGWQEGLKEMKWLADFMLSRGINRFVPHAFTSADFPDRDCPPHIYAQGENPQYRYFKYLSAYMSRVCAKISGGRALAQTAVLYHAEAEWSGKPFVKTQEIIKLLTQAQIEADIVPLDAFEGCKAEGGCAILGECRYRAIIVPFSSALPANGLRALEALAEVGIKVVFENALPAAVEENEVIPVLGACTAAPRANLVPMLKNLGLATLHADKFEPDLKTYPYMTAEGKICLVFNESVNDDIDTFITADWLTAPALYDPMYENTVRLAQCGHGFRLKLNPGELGILLNDSNLKYEPELTETDELPLDNWKVSLAAANEYPVFTPCPQITEPRNLFARDALKDFSGTIRYQTSFCACADDLLMLHLGTVGETADVFLNGRQIGVKLSPPYDFKLKDCIKQGINDLTIDVTNTLVYKMKDVFSVYHALKPSGLVGPVRLVRLK